MSRRVEPWQEVEDPLAAELERMLRAAPNDPEPLVRQGDGAGVAPDADLGPYDD